ncbi:hypothetical protein [Alphaproteobacteria bacterium endosymbiont of Tiliacea citrago]|uniref:hypothetical protein n=1 Tax=Alphaproteobacteria bacterium endosymbiont of Tiliacea citrago TaxID=3077944 RepID=UPI00313CE73B
MKKINAFSLLELTLSLSIMGLMLTSLTILHTLISKMNKKDINETKYHHIRIAMQNYLLKNGKLPYASKNEDGNSSITLYQGYVPYKTLGISKTYLYDANNRAFLYVVNPLLTDTNIPIQTPLSYYPKEKEKSFLRLYKQHENILYHDYYSQENQLEIFDEKNISVIEENDYFFVLTQQPKNFKTQKELDQWVARNIDNKDEQYKVQNIIAWLIITNNHKKNDKMKFYINKQTSIFFQTRFDMAAQIGFYCSAEPLIY